MNVDPEQLKRVVNNIISNSVKYMAEGRQGKIKIDLYDEGDYIHAIFSDNGIGIAAKMLREYLSVSIELMNQETASMVEVV